MARMKYEANGITIEIIHGSCVGNKLKIERVESILGIFIFN